MIVSCHRILAVALRPPPQFGTQFWTGLAPPAADDSFEKGIANCLASLTKADQGRPIHEGFTVGLLMSSSGRGTRQVTARIWPCRGTGQVTTGWLGRGRDPLPQPSLGWVQ